MLSVFPIQFLALFAYFLLRVCVGMILLMLGFRHYVAYDELKHTFRQSWWPYGGFSAAALVLFEILTGVLIIVGAYTQLATLLVALFCLKVLLLRHLIDHHTIPNRLFYFLLFGACISLTITGAGAFAFDLPL